MLFEYYMVYVVGIMAECLNESKKKKKQKLCI